MKSFYLLLLFPIFAFGQNLTPPTISHQSGFYADEFYLHISHPDPNVTILYTLDGSEPKFENLDGKVWNYKKVYPTNPGDAFGELLSDTSWTYKYIDSILVRDRTNDRDLFADISASYYTNALYNDNAKQDSNHVFKGVVVQFVTYENGLYSNVTTKNYFVSPQKENRYSLPILCLTVEPEKFYGYENGLNVPGILFDEWRNSEDTHPVYSLAPGNFRASGTSSEIPLNFSYIVDNDEVLNQRVGLRLHGNGSRFFPNRSFRLYAKSEYGESNFNYPFFPNYDHSSFKRLILRNSGNDVLSTMFRDAFIQQSVKHLNFEIQEYQPVILFTNSEYSGIYNIRERYDDKFFKRKYNINTSELDHIENHGIVSEGDADFYNIMYSFCETYDLSDSNNYSQLEKMMDIESFTDYYITEIFIANHDWPQNNNELWRKKVTYNPNAVPSHDGRFRWLLKDLDISFGMRYDDSDVLSNSLHRVTTISSDTSLNQATIFIRKLIENSQYQKYFINRFSDLLNTTFSPERFTSIINTFAERLNPEMNEYIRRWNPSGTNLENLWWAFPVYSFNEWNKNVNDLIDYANIRPGVQRNHLNNRFNLSGQVSLILDIDDHAKGYIHLNTIDILPSTAGISSNTYPWTGIYFKENSITISAIPASGSQFSHWSGSISSTDSVININLSETSYIKANFKTIDVPEDYLALDDFTLDNKIEIYPNPFEDKINVYTDLENATYKIYSIDGKLVQIGEKKSSIIEVSNLPSGLFIFELKSDQNTVRKQIIKK